MDARSKVIQEERDKGLYRKSRFRDLEIDADSAPLLAKPALL